MLSIARAALTNPAVLMLDEPSEGLAPLIVNDVRDAIVEINRQGVAILLVEQKIAIPVAICRRIYVVAGVRQTVERRSEVVEIAVESVEPLLAFLEQLVSRMGLRLLGELEEMLCVAVAEIAGLAGFLEFLGGVFANCFEHPVATVVVAEEAFVDE